MTMQKPLYLNATEGVPQECNPSTDEVTLGRITLNGIGGQALVANGNAVTGLPTPVNPSDAATMAWVQSVINGYQVKPAVQAFATSNITLSGTQTVDGVALTAGQRVLVGGQTTASQNGIYTVVSGAAWTRTSDMAAGASANGAYVFVEQGTVNADTGWLCTNLPGSDVVGTASLTFAQFTGLGDVTVTGGGLSKSGNALSANINATGGLQASGGLAILLATNPGLQTGSGGLSLLLPSSSGLQLGASGLSVALPASAGLSLSASGLAVNVGTSSALAVNSNVLGVQLNGTTLGITAGSGLAVLGLPSAFTVAGVATSTNVTAANLNTLTAGSASAADALHTHNTIAAATNASNVQASFTNGGTALNAGDPVCWSATANTLARGDCSAAATSRVIGIAIAACAASANATILRDGVATNVLSGATPNTPYYLASGGGLTTTVPTASGNRLIRVGWAKNATDLHVCLADMGQRA